MLACHHNHALHHVKGSDSQAMEKYSTDALEKTAFTGTYRSSLKTISNDVKTAKHVTFDLSGDEKQKGFDGVLDKVGAVETYSGKPTDVEAAKSAVVFMGFPQHLVQLVVDAGALDPTYSFNDAAHLFLLVSDLAANPNTQEDIHEMLNKQQQASEALPVSRGNAKTPAENPDDVSSRKMKTPAENPDDVSSRKMKNPAENPDDVLGSSTKSPAKIPDDAFDRSTKNPVENPDDVLGSTPSVKHDCHNSLPAGMLEETCQSSMTSSSSDIPTSSSGDSSNCLQNVTEPSGADSSSLPEAWKKSSDTVKAEASQPKAATPEASQVLSSSAARTEATPTQGPVSADRSPREELKERVKKLAAENLKLTQRKMCRACRKVDLSSDGVTFLPCGHFITCEACSENFDDCPACGKSILGTVKTFLS